LDDARHTYSVPHWSEGYFDLDSAGRVIARPFGSGGPTVPLLDVVREAAEAGLRIPLLARFPDILTHRLQRLQGAFVHAIQAHDYGGDYSAIYPIKVNQQASVVSELVRSGSERFGLEAGSKPELMAVLALSPGGLVICNGYKDREYIRLALIGRKLGLDVIIVIEKANELALVMEEAEQLGVTPALGVRLRLASIGHGKWQNTGGDKAKFGLLPGQLLELVAELGRRQASAVLKLLHFHMGSQIANLRDVAAGLREAVRYWVELCCAGHRIEYLDVGGGLAIDYEGTRSRSDCSMNYGLAQYADTVVGLIAEAARTHDLPPPRILTEAGRAMTAHHAVLITDVTAVEAMPSGRAHPPEDVPPTLQPLARLLADLEQRPPVELVREAQFHLAEGQARFAEGTLDLKARAQLDDLYYALVHGVRARLDPRLRSHRELLDELDDKLADKYFVNFSVFQSVPDVWALEQVFPIMPLDRHWERPLRRGVLEDLTCDSDGRIDRYVDREGLERSMALHEPKPGERYYLGVFLVGAYQETLGDIHNLFGDTDTVNVRWSGSRFELAQPKQGDNTDELLRYVGYDLDRMRLAYRARVTAARLSLAEAKAIHAALEAGLSGYTYLHD
jgi:arginine decarboxylase